MPPHQSGKFRPSPESPATNTLYTGSRPRTTEPWPRSVPEQTAVAKLSFSNCLDSRVPEGLGVCCSCCGRLVLRVVAEHARELDFELLGAPQLSPFKPDYNEPRRRIAITQQPTQGADANADARKNGILGKIMGSSFCGTPDVGLPRIPPPPNPAQPGGRAFRISLIRPAPAPVHALPPPPPPPDEQVQVFARMGSTNENTFPAPPTPHNTNTASPIKKTQTLPRIPVKSHPGDGRNLIP